MNIAKDRKKSFWRPAVRAGQILFPSLLVIPSLLLFVYLLFETTKISREKIRQQFAVDSAAFIQMGDYTNLLNRTAYVDGTFPYRIFKEAYECPPETPMHLATETGDICPFDMLYAAGAFPKYAHDVKGAQPSSLDGVKRWDILFDNTARPEFTNNPGSQENKPLFDLVTKKQGADVMIEWGTAIGYYKFYSQVYSLLGTVEKSQWTVFDRLTENFNFFRKSYYLNSNACDPSQAQACGNDGVFSTGGFSQNRLVKGNNFFMHYIQKIGFAAKVFTGGSLPPYYLGYTTTPMDMTSMDADGLFQLATVSDSMLDKLGRGIDVYQGWNPPQNYFKVDFTNIAKCKETGRPCVHAKITTQCPNLQGVWPGSEANNCVWPNPTPKYQTRLYP